MGNGSFTTSRDKDNSRWQNKEEFLTILGEQEETDGVY